MTVSVCWLLPENLALIHLSPLKLRPYDAIEIFIIIIITHSFVLFSVHETSKFAQVLSFQKYGFAIHLPSSGLNSHIHTLRQAKLVPAVV